MTKEKKLTLVKAVCEFAIGFTVASALDNATNAKGAVSKTLVAIGAVAIGYAVGCKFDDEFDKLFNKNSTKKTEHDFA